MKNNLLDYKIGQRGEREWMRDTQSYKTDKGIVNVYCFQPNKIICQQGKLFWVKIIFTAYMQSVRNKSFKSRLYIVFRQLFSSADVKCKKPIVSSFELLFCCNYALLWQKIMIYFTKKMLQGYFVEFIV